MGKLFAEAEITLNGMRLVKMFLLKMRRILLGSENLIKFENNFKTQKYWYIAHVVHGMNMKIFFYILKRTKKFFNDKN